MRELRSIVKPSLEVKLIAQVVLMLLGERDSVKFVCPPLTTDLQQSCAMFSCLAGLADMSIPPRTVRSGQQRAALAPLQPRNTRLARHRQTLPDVEPRRLPQRAAFEPGCRVAVRLGDERAGRAL